MTGRGGGRDRIDRRYELARLDSVLRESRLW